MASRRSRWLLASVTGPFLDPGPLDLVGRTFGVQGGTRVGDVLGQAINLRAAQGLLSLRCPRDQTPTLMLDPPSSPLPIE